MKLTLGEAKERVAAAAGLCATDTRVASYVNRAIRRLLPKGKWFGTTQRYRICVNSDCITWPRAIQTIELAAVERTPRAVRNEWFEFLESGMGVLNGDSANGLQLTDRGEVCAFDDITAGSTTAYIRVYADVVEASAKYIILRGYDENANWIRTQFAGSWIDGEKVTLPTSPATPAVTTKKFSRLVQVIKDTTNGVIRLYEYNGSSNVRALAFYEPDEKLPSYRRSYIPGLRNVHTSGDCEKASVEVVAKLRHYDVSNDNDFLLIGNLEALEMEVQALRNFDNRNFEEGYKNEAYAVRLLNEELSHTSGDGPVNQIRVVGDGTYGAAWVENVI